MNTSSEQQRVTHLAEVEQRRHAALFLQRNGKTQEQAAAEQAANERELKTAMEYGKTLRDEYDRNAPGVLQAKRDRTACQLKHREAAANLREKERPLDPLSFPSDVQIKKHAAELQAARATLAEIEEKFHDADRRCGALLECIKLARAIQTQEYVVRNLKTLCEGGSPGTLTGGLSTSEDFFGHLQTPML